MDLNAADASCIHEESSLLPQEDFDAVMKEYPESSKAMDLIAEHRLRTLHASAAWRSKQDAVSKIASLGSKIEHVLEVCSLHGKELWNCRDCLHCMLAPWYTAGQQSLVQPLVTSDPCQSKLI